MMRIIPPICALVVVFAGCNRDQHDVIENTAAETTAVANTVVEKPISEEQKKQNAECSQIFACLVGTRCGSCYASLREALIAKGEDAMPFLVETLVTGNDDRRDAALLAGIPLMSDGYSHHAASVLALLGSDAASAVPALVEAFQTGPNNVRTKSAYVLANIGPTARVALPHFEAALHDDNLTLRCSAAIALWKLDQRTEATVPVLIEALKKGDECLRFAAVRNLKEMGPQAQAAVPALIAGLKDEFICVEAANALSRIGPQAKQAIPALTEAASEIYSPLREASIRALSRIGPDAKSALPTIRKSLKDDDPG